MGLAQFIIGLNNAAIATPPPEVDDSFVMLWDDTTELLWDDTNPVLWDDIDWILQEGVWNDSGAWDDFNIWIDSVV